MRYVLLDTSVLIDFLKSKSNKNSSIRKILEDDKGVLSPLVKLELLMGVKKEERKDLEYILEGLRPANISLELFKVAEKLIPLVRKEGIQPGLIDYLIVLQALADGYDIATNDKVLSKVCKALGVKVCDS